MNPTTVAIITIVLCLVLILLETPVAVAIGGSGLVGIVLLDGIGLAAQSLGAIPYSGSAKYALFAIPTYILLGCLISNAGIGTQIYRVVNKLVRPLPGGLAATAVLATSIFSGISGSSAADVATFGRISVNEMTRNGYRKPYAAAVVAAAGTFAVLIPPSITLVLYAIIAQVSIGAMILAGVIPGILSGLILAAYVIVRARLARNNEDDDAHISPENARETPATLADPSTALMTKPARGTDLIAIGYATILFGVVVGGLYAGIFTATEAGAVGAIAAMIIALIAIRGKKIGARRLMWESMTETAEITSMIFLLLIGGAIFSFALALSGLPVDISLWAGDLPIAPWAVIAIILLILIPLGAFLDGLSVLLLTVPIIAPIAVDLGFNGVWFGILVLKVVEVGLITPPVGINAFIISSITNAKVEKVYRALIPFVILDLAVTALFFIFPEIVLWLPRVSGLI